MTVFPCQLKSVGNFVHVWFEERQNGTESTGSVASLVIVVVDKYECTQWRQLVPVLTVVPEVGQLLPVVLAYDVTEVFTVPEISDSTNVDIFRLNTRVDHLPLNDIP